jgi:hypothetical protein
LQSSVQFGLSPPSNVHKRAFSHEALGRSQADARVAARNERYFAGEFLRVFHIKKGFLAWFQQGTINSYSWLLKPIILPHKLVTCA